MACAPDRKIDGSQGTLGRARGLDAGILGYTHRRSRQFQSVTRCETRSISLTGHAEQTRLDRLVWARTARGRGVVEMSGVLLVAVESDRLLEAREGRQATEAQAGASPPDQATTWPRNHK
jgi:hypothetical protein